MAKVWCYTLDLDITTVLYDIGSDDVVQVPRIHHLYECDDSSDELGNGTLDKLYYLTGFPIDVYLLQKAIRDYGIVETEKPTITILGSNPIFIGHGKPYNDAGATAYDVGDGDLTSEIITLNYVDSNVLGDYLVTYNVEDSEGNAADEVARVVHVVDDTIPIISLIGHSPIVTEYGTPYADDGATAYDNIDGDITANIITVNPVDTDVLGAYEVTYNVEDSSQNQAVEVVRIVNVVDTVRPVITRLGETPVDVVHGSDYVDAGATALDNHDGDITADIVTVNPVDTMVDGSYEVTYDVHDSSLNDAIQAVRVVNVLPYSANDCSLSIGGSSTYDYALAGYWYNDCIIFAEPVEII